MFEHCYLIHIPQWCVNVLGYHRVTKALLPRLSATARVVMVASFYAGEIAHSLPSWAVRVTRVDPSVGGLDLTDAMFRKRAYDVDSAYVRKL